MSKHYRSKHLQLKTSSLGDYLQAGEGQHAILAHGSAVGMQHEFMQRWADALIDHGFKVSLFNYQYMQTIQATGKRRPPARVPVLLHEHQQWLDLLGYGHRPLLMGKSLGGRMSSLMAQTHAQQVAGWCALGYPFHPQAKPQTLRTEHLLTNQAPGLIVQGTRDALGNQQEVEGYALPNSIKVHWLENMDHGFKPYKGAPLDQWQAILQSAAWVKAWYAQLPGVAALG